MRKCLRSRLSLAAAVALATFFALITACQHTTAPSACHLDTRPDRVILTLWSQDDPPIRLRVDTLWVPDTTTVCGVTSAQ